jgi:pantetheine-phosphate adenylyltransferase
MFTVEQRMEMLRADTAHLKNVRVISFEGHLANFVIENGYNAMFRGLRSESDFGYEIQLEHIYRKFFDGKAETVYLMTDPQYSYISSSIVRENYLLGADISGWVSEEVYEMMKKYKSIK